MTSFFETFNINSRGFCDIKDITPRIQEIVRRSGIENGTVCVSIAGSTASITTIEYESGVLKDLRDAIQRMAPENIPYAHDARWHDGNGFSHVRAALLGPSQTFPVVQGKVLLGTWQQIVLCDFDNNPRNRRINVMVVG